MKLRVPSDCGCVSYQGRSLAIDSERSIDVDEIAAGILAAHGFVSVTRSNVELESECKQIDAVAKLNRNALFALLRSKGVSVSLPITNEALRAAAQRALERAD